jgi:hypothetical protein
VARRGDELTPGVEEALQAAGHRVEGPAQLVQLARASLGCAHGEVARGELRRRDAKEVDAACDR